MVFYIVGFPLEVLSVDISPLEGFPSADIASFVMPPLSTSNIKAVTTNPKRVLNVSALSKLNIVFLLEFEPFKPEDFAPILYSLPSIEKIY